MTDRRKTELLGNFIGWFLDHQTSDEGLFRDLHVEIGMTKDVLVSYVKTVLALQKENLGPVLKFFEVSNF